MLKGNKVELRPWRRTDKQYRLKWWNDPEVTQYIGSYLPVTEMQEGTSSYRDGAVFFVEAIKDGENIPIGSIGLKPDSADTIDRDFVFGIIIGEKDFWDKGYGTEATELVVRYGFEQLNLNRITSNVYAFNERSLRMHRKVGFTEEGRKRKAVFVNGKYHDQVLFGLLRDEWLSAGVNLKEVNDVKG